MIANNFTYFIKETFTIYKTNKLSSLLSLISLSMIFFISILIISGWGISREFVNLLKDEAAISVYYTPNLNSYSLDELKDAVLTIDGVTDIAEVSADESYSQMESILGSEAKILNQFDENPFVPYIEVSVQLDKAKTVGTKIGELSNVDYVRDNQSVLDKIAQISLIIGSIGLLMTVTVGVATVLITSHIIREGVHTNEAQINTLQLLGAPDLFIHLPFWMSGVLISFSAGILALLMTFVVQINLSAGGDRILPFLPEITQILSFGKIALGVILCSVVIGAASSGFGLRMVKKR